MSSLVGAEGWALKEAAQSLSPMRGSWVHQGLGGGQGCLGAPGVSGLAPPCCRRALVPVLLVGGPMSLRGFPGGSAVKNLPAVQEPQEIWVQSLGQEDPRRRAWQPTPVFLPEESHGQRSPVGYSPWGHVELLQLK